MKCICLLILLCLPLARAQSLGSEFEALKKKRDEGMKQALAPIDKTFIELASKLIAKAIQNGEMDVADHIKKSLPPPPSPDLLPKDEFDVLLESTSWDYHASSSSQSQITLKFKSGGKIISSEGFSSFDHWEKIDSRKMKVLMKDGREITYDYRSSERRFYAMDKGVIYSITAAKP